MAQKKVRLAHKLSIPLVRAELLIPQPSAFEFSEPLQSTVTANKGVGARVQVLLTSPRVSGTAAVLRLCPSGVGCDKVILLLDAELHSASDATKYEIQGCSLLLSAHWGGWRQKGAEPCSPVLWVQASHCSAALTGISTHKLVFGGGGNEHSIQIPM